MYVEIVVGGTLGELAASAFPELVITRRCVYLTSEADALAALDHLTHGNVDVLLVRQRPHPYDGN